ncbi:hypothetical protein BG57_30520 [Caballeronia grimmiae]|uniref:Uncharacterized protein n=1 Tax=Caballeronia grimmiae TaxID=1071679 RepID=A0A069NAM1_9BURK|nr:hypothetical protein BG57_30520 [Caballeronia grimmiae]
MRIISYVKSTGNMSKNELFARPLVRFAKRFTRLNTRENTRLTLTGIGIGRFDSVSQRQDIKFERKFFPIRRTETEELKQR